MGVLTPRDPANITTGEPILEITDASLTAELQSQLDELDCYWAVADRLDTIDDRAHNSELLSLDIRESLGPVRPEGVIARA